MAFNFKSLFGAQENSSDRRTKERVKLPDDATILIIDDSRTAIAVLKKTLEPTGFSIISAFNAEDGIEMAKTHQLLTDLDAVGFNLRKESVTEHIPIVIISGNEQATEKFWGMRVGANGFLPKPVDRGELFHLLREHLSESKLI